jgi:hypothetical protein
MSQEAVIVNDKQTSDMPRHTQEAVIEMTNKPQICLDIHRKLLL